MYFQRLYRKAEHCNNLMHTSVTVCMYKGVVEVQRERERN